MVSESPRQFNTSEPSDGNGSSSTGTQGAINKGAEIDVSTHTGPAAWKQRIRVPAHGELERQRVSNDNPRGRLRGRRDGVCGSCGNDTRVSRLGRGMQEHVEMGTNVQMAELQCSRQSNDQGYVVVAQTALSFDRICRALRWWRVRGHWARGDATGQGSVVVHVKLEKMEELVRDEVERAVHVLFHAKVELERSASLIAG